MLTPLQPGSVSKSPILEYSYEAYFAGHGDMAEHWKPSKRTAVKPVVIVVPVMAEYRWSPFPSDDVEGGVRKYQENGKMKAWS